MSSLPRRVEDGEQVRPSHRRVRYEGLQQSAELASGQPIATTSHLEVCGLSLIAPDGETLASELRGEAYDWVCEERQGA